MPESNPPPTTVAPSSDSKKSWSALAEYCFKNPFLVLWNVALVLGGLITFAHFMSIGYFPDLDVKSASSFLLGVALLGVSLMVMLAVMLVVPSYLIRTQVWTPYCLHQPVEIGLPSERVPKELEKGRRVPFVVMSFLHGSIAFFFWTFATSFTIPDSYEKYITIVRACTTGGFALSILGLYGLYLFLKKKSLKLRVNIDSFAGHGYGAQHVQLIFIWLFVYPGYLLLLALAASKLHHEDVAGHAGLLAFGFVFTFANTSLSVASLDTPKSYWIVPMVATLLALVYLNIPSNPFNITRAVFTSLAIGDLDNTRFVVKRPTCDAVNLMAPRTCKVVSEAMGCIYPKNLANRIGSEYLLLLEVSTVTKGQNASNAISPSIVVKIPIPKSEVLAWGVIRPKSPSDTACGPIFETNDFKQ
jgi:hypothetical protein